MSKYYGVEEIDELDNMTCEVFGEDKEKAVSYLKQRHAVLKSNLTGYEEIKTENGYKFENDNKFVEISLVETEV